MKLVNLVIWIALLFGIPAGQLLAQDTSENPASYWTPERMADAKPMDNAVPGDPHVAIAPAAQGAPGIVGGSLPGEKTELKVPPAFLDRERQAAAQPANWDLYPGPNTTFRYEPSYRDYPVSTAGRIYFRQPYGDNWCSGNVITGSSARNTVWTAGHCMTDGWGTWFGQFLFCPSYRNVFDPTVGCWPFLSVSVPREWFAHHAWSRDFAILTLRDTGTVINRNVAEVTGGLGFAWNLPRRQNWVHMGYPGNTPFTGRFLIWTGAERTFDDNIDNRGPPANSWGTTQGPGSSGSALITNFQFAAGQSGGGYVNSNVAYYYASHPLQTQGPYFDTRVCNFFRRVTGASVTC